MKRIVWLGVAAAAIAAIAGLISWQVVLAPLFGLFIYSIGVASFGSLRRGASHIPDGPPEDVDPETERVTYTCSGCEAQVLLLVRGVATPPRHCGERMQERREVPHLP